MAIRCCSGVMVFLELGLDLGQRLHTRPLVWREGRFVYPSGTLFQICLRRATARGKWLWVGVSETNDLR